MLPSPVAVSFPPGVPLSAPSPVPTAVIPVQPVSGRVCVCTRAHSLVPRLFLIGNEPGDEANVHMHVTVSSLLQISTTHMTTLMTPLAMEPPPSSPDSELVNSGGEFVGMFLVNAEHC